ncbi:5618_t:CDS:1 [Funneliformis geosporum]|uniref:9517_t:CDS:1 n=1 Tax=Funneliformis geosporum TaxID=1117311 RepID=A0A9W4WV00_9GLOM|nr:5618_t:CDS:1 [Funneliformis geosporum]CAI2165632.1 9517_t:CDS:1 [Funneliformis geosporum]
MSATTAKLSVTVAAGSRGFSEYDRHYSTVHGRRIGIQDLINEPVRSLSSVSTSPVEPHLQNHLNRHPSPELGSNQFSRYSLSPPQPHLPLPIPTPSMELDSYKLLTPLTSPTQIPVTPSNYSPTSNSTSSSVKSEDQNSYMTTIQTSGMIMPLSLQERRERNKIASAKYRAKKHKQNQEMSSTIAELSAENNVLLRQLEEAKSENLELKEYVDKLKSKLMEGKLLKRLGRGGAKSLLSPTSPVEDLDITSNVSTTIRKSSTKRGGLSSHAKGTGPSTKGSRK